MLPGFIDCHTHICYAGSRSIEYSKKNAGISYQKILSEGGGIYDTMEKTRLASDEELIKNTISRLERHFFEGVLTCEVKSGYGINFDQEIRLLKIINEINLSHPSDVIPTCLAAHVPPNDSQTSTGEYLKLIVKELFPILRKENLTNRIDIFVENNQTWKGEDFETKIIHVPGHTSGHICFYFVKDKIAFTGDTLFSLGCGRIFEGAYEQMFASLNKLKKLPIDTKVYCGHEYTLKNSMFCSQYEKNNKNLEKKIFEIEYKLKNNLPTIPSTIKEELACNIFLRAKNLEDFSKLRDLKDNF